ncbi:MAG TPA: PLD nuclease N-terminal domain-containing protein [Gammaproteobacteria bacterium]|nr:PLD nuclease N-terminal domain-containing protein [Gammaproteobacteria bacterium]
MSAHVYSLWGLIILLLDLWAIISVINSTHVVANKVFWVLLILILPIAGFIIWFLLGPKSQ